MEITPSEWLIELLGYNEKDLLSKIKKDEKIILNEKYKKIKGGEFNLYTLSELKNTITDSNINININNNINKSIPMFTIYVRNPGNHGDMYYDTSSLQRIIKSDKPVMFQVASNFNCHENASPQTNLFSGYYLTNLMEDSTQGPSASAGAGAGAIIRLNYHHKYPIQLLKYTDAHVVNGKLVGIGKDLEINKIQIGLQTDITSNYDRSEFGRCIFYSDNSPIIDQVFTSTIALSKGCCNINQLNASNVLLHAAYSGTYLAAITRGTKKLVLTMIGGGVFNNPIDQILDSMIHAHIAYAPISNLEEVILPLYNININPNEIVNKLVKKGYPADHIQVIKK